VIDAAGSKARPGSTSDLGGCQRVLLAVLVVAFTAGAGWMGFSYGPEAVRDGRVGSGTGLFIGLFGLFLMPLAILAVLLLVTITWRWVGARLRVLAVAALATQAAAAYCYVRAQTVGYAAYFHRGFRQRVEHRVGLAALQQWAEQVLRSSQYAAADGSEGSPIEVDPKQVPPTVAGLGFRWEPRVLRYTEPGDRHVEIVLGGGFRQWGVAVGPPGYDPEPTGFAEEFFPYADGVYGFDGP
jgi:hypothetical protein